MVLVKTPGVVVQTQHPSNAAVQNAANTIELIYMYLPINWAKLGDCNFRGSLDWG
jgi:hypothetical protein